MDSDSLRKGREVQGKSRFSYAIAVLSLLLPFIRQRTE